MVAVDVAREVCGDSADPHVSVGAARRVFVRPGGTAASALAEGVAPTCAEMMSFDDASPTRVEDRP